MQNYAAAVKDFVERHACGLTVVLVTGKLMFLLLLYLICTSFILPTFITIVF